MPHTLFISDLHLSPARPAINELFFDFLAVTAQKAEALYILGDLFEYWAGDDSLEEPFNQEVASGLATLSGSGVRLYLMHGNRDFLLGERFSRLTGAQLLPDPTLLNLYDVPTLLMHGDTLCTDDVAYMAFRAQVRQPQWQESFLSQPLAQRIAVIEGLRRDSQTEQKQKAPEILDANPDTILRVLAENGWPRLIHGHTHRSAHHVHQAAGHSAERWVLPDWYETGGFLRCDAKGCALETL